MKTKYLIFLFLLTTNCVFAQLKHTVTKSTVTFKIKNMGFNVSGTFSGLQATIMFDPAKLDSSSINASIDAATINTDVDMRDNHLRSDDYFDVAKYPRITVKSVTLEHKSGDNYTGRFNVTIRDKTIPLDMPFTYADSGNTATFTGTLKLKRSDFGIGGSSMVMSNDVTVTIDVEATK